MVLQAKVKARYHVTATSFANDFCSLFQNVLNSEATSSTENGSSKDDKSASAKKAKAHAKRIIKAVQPLLEEAVRAEAEVSGRPVETELKDLGHLIEISMQMQPAPAPLGDTENSGIQDLDTDMADGIVMQSTEIDAGDVVMEDVDAPGEIDTQDEVIVPESIGLPGREGAISTDIQDGTQGKDEGKQAHGTKSAPTPPDTNGYVSAPEDAPSLQPSPPTPPISNGGTGNDRLDALTKGGALWYLAPFQPEGTSLIQPKDPATPFHDDLSDVEGALGPDIGEVTAAVNTSSPTKSRKGKAKKKPRGKK
jgi:NuA3 HAT complex component NTO1